jgi:hypothetical protein
MTKLRVASHGPTSGPPGYTEHSAIVWHRIHDAERNGPLRWFATGPAPSLSCMTNAPLRWWSARGRVARHTAGA